MPEKPASRQNGRSRKALQSHLADKSRDGRLTFRPEPRGPEVEAVRGWLTLRIYRQDAAAGPVPGLEQHVLEGGLLQSPCRIQPGKSGAENGHLGLDHVLVFLFVRFVGTAALSSGMASMSRCWSGASLIQAVAPSEPTRASSVWRAGSRPSFAAGGSLPVL